MDWQNDEFETFLRKFRLKETRFILLRPVNVRHYRMKMAAVASLVLVIGASAGILRQRSIKSDVPALVETPVETSKEAPQLQAIETPVGVPTATASTIPPVPQPRTPSIKPDPKAPEPLKQLTVVVPAAPQDAGPLSKQDSPQQAGTEEDKGHKPFLAACGSCHSVDLVGNTRLETHEEASAIVNRMVSIGAAVSPQEASAIVDYIFKTYGKKPAATADDRGKTVFNMACGLCHAAEVVDGRKGADKETYRSIVNNMIAYGAGVAPDQIDPLVEYLFTTYGKKLN